ncbi:CPBP family intramembrane glutamic endopeptidase [Halobaculum marinum]|uniref:CPBP family intramembrane glutamic endopeptidase n=1 Tax=Halobaculum marinum TaxID=3031996 RepID=A0ABD5X553_9EURY|nr:CPBP family intramembrane glutamic endopeptidase [Halobaculum sp. DT55]
MELVRTVATRTPSRARVRRFGYLYVLGLLGVAAAAATTLVVGPLPSPLASLSPVVAFLLVALQPAVLLAVAVVVGGYAAPRVGLRSHVRAYASGNMAAWHGFRSELRTAVLLGALAGGTLLVLGWLVGPVGAVSGERATVATVLAGVPLRFLYGGITEELLLRWGLLSAVAALLWRVGGGDHGRLSSPVAWAAILVAAVLFGVGHLPTAATLYGELTPDVVAFVVLGNSLGGVAYGWLFWRHSLEAAMVGHATTHVVFVAASLVFLHV